MRCWCDAVKDQDNVLLVLKAITVGDSTTSILQPVQDEEAEENGCISSTHTVVLLLLCQNGTDFSYGLHPLV